MSIISAAMEGNQNAYPFSNLGSASGSSSGGSSLGLIFSIPKKRTFRVLMLMAVVGVFSLFAVSRVQMFEYRLVPPPPGAVVSSFLNTDRHLEVISMDSNPAQHSASPSDNVQAAFLSSWPGWSKKPDQASSPCWPVLERASYGQWVPRPHTAQEKAAIDKFIVTVRGYEKLPVSVQRRDNRCGNVNMAEKGRPGGLSWYKALCDPAGPRSCCHSNHTCVSLTVSQCQCDGCQDLRQQIHAELSTWVPHDTHCKVRQSMPHDTQCKVRQSMPHDTQCQVRQSMPHDTQCKVRQSMPHDAQCKVRQSMPHDTQCKVRQSMPHDTQCKIKIYKDESDICPLLENMTIHVIGDSFMRQVFISLLGTLRSKYRDGVITDTKLPRVGSRESFTLLQIAHLFVRQIGKNNATKIKRSYGTPDTEFRTNNENHVVYVARIEHCDTYMRYFSKCSDVIPTNATECGGTVRFLRKSLWRASQIGKIVKVFEQYVAKPNSFVIFGLGIHDMYYPDKVISKILTPVLAVLKKRPPWPQLIWVAPQSPGLLKTPLVKQQQRASVAKYKT
ncbi:tRNA(1-methyladenosine) methyltransferase, subunit GCD14 [Elysia marginata]|uniref:tRNA(1-methyladenosine) methyltransferase, subunit GCD14 n=1 Tax=Elysia marginata TaxID=1093978 RepID=A0AAV4IA70_9GAST|nr:tRNA(1-methyladenosine) methyltransferase, subunit GCD14 [Elysia marginata]